MSANVKEWLVVLIFLLIFLGLTVFEALLLKRRGWTNFGKALAFTAATNLIGFVVGGFVIFVVFGVTLALAWEGSLEKFPFGELGIIVALIAGVLFFPIFLALCKRLFLLIFKIVSGRAAWFYSFAAAFGVFLVSYGAPILAGYLIFKFL